jgi:hypothetical protein
MKRFATAFAGWLVVLSVLAAPAQAAPVPPTECSAELYAGDARLGPAELPRLGPVGVQLVGYSRTGHRPPEVFLERYYDTAAGSWRYPPGDGFILGPGGRPVKTVDTLVPGRLVDRYGSEYGGFLAPAGLPYTARSIPPSNMVGTPAAGCNYHVYEVLRPFDVHSGPIAPWFFQRGGGAQYQLAGALVPGAPARLSVLWLVDNGYLGRVVSPST